MAYSLTNFGSDTIASDVSGGYSSLTLTTGAFGSPTGTQILVIEPTSASKRQVISCTITGTSITSVAHLAGNNVGHTAGATIISAFSSYHYTNGLGQIAAGDAWTSFSPTWGNISVGNGIVEAKLRQVGVMVYYRIQLSFGSTTSVSGDATVTLPVTAKNYRASTTTAVQPISAASAWDDSAGTSYILSPVYNSTANIRLMCVDASGTYAKNAVLSSTVPFTWTTSDGIYIQGTYEAATAAGA